MRFIQEIGFTIKVGQEEAHQQWLVANEERLAKAHPEGTRYIGTFSVVFSSEKNAGFYRSFVELDSYAALDRLAAARPGSVERASQDAARLECIR